MNEGLKIQVSADVQQATNALKNLNTNLAATQKATVNTSAALPKLGDSSKQATFALTNFSRVVQDAPFGIIGIANNIDPLIQSFTALKASTGSTGAALKALAGSLIGGGGLALAVSVVTSAFTFFALRQRESNAESKKTADSAKEITTAFNGEQLKIGLVVSALENLNLSRKETLNLQEQLKKSAPGFNQVYKNEFESVSKLSFAWAAYGTNLKNALANKVIEAEVQVLIEEYQKIQKLFLDIDRRNDSRAALGLKPLSEEILLYDEQTKKLQNGVTLRQRQVEIEKTIAGKFKEQLQYSGETLQNLIDGIKQTNSQVDVLEEYRKKLDAINFKERALGVSLLNDKIDLATSTFESFINKGLKETSKELIFISLEINKFLAQIQKVQKAGEQGLIGLDINSAIPNYDKLIAKQKEFIATGLPEKANKTSSIFLTPEATSRQIELLEQVRKKNEEIAQIQQLTGSLFSSLGNDLTNFFTSVGRDGENAFKRLGEAVKETTTRIITQFIVAQALKTLLNSIAPGSGTAVDLGGSFGGGNGISNFDVTNLRILGGG